jgi:hypothetical protein
MMAVGIYLMIFLVMALAIIPAGMLLGWRLGRILLKWIEDEDARDNHFQRADMGDDQHDGAGRYGTALPRGQPFGENRPCYIGRRMQLIRETEVDV